MSDVLTQTDATGALFWPLAYLRPHPANPRGPVARDASLDELAASIRAQGVLQPLVILNDGTVIAGHRRLAAAQMVGLAQVPVMLREMSAAQQVAAMLTENLMRADLTPLQEGHGYKQLLALGMNRAEIGRHTGVSAPRVGDHLALLELDPLVQELLGRRELPITLVRPLARIIDPARQRQVASLVAKRLLTVLDVQRLVDGEPAVTKPAASLPPDQARRQGAPNTAGRATALRAIRERAGTMVPVDRLGQAMEGVCEICDQCGCKDIEVICQACPVPRLVLRVLA